jgi:tRNA(Ile)-lysidine synthase
VTGAVGFPQPRFAGLDPPVVVACSGGADSLALLVVASEAGLRPVAVHVDHGLRPDSAREADVVARTAARLGADFLSRSVALATGSNLEARARAMRYAALERARIEVGASAVLTGHTADDQAETVLLNLIRGAATGGLGGIPERSGPLVRPLLGVRRADTVELCRRLGLVPVADSMNLDHGYRRVFLRREVIPALERAANRDLVPVLARQAEILRTESALLDELADEALRAAGGREPSARSFAGLAPALARRVVRRWLGSPPPSFDEVERVLRVARGEAVAAELAGGRRVARRDGLLRLGTRASRGGFAVPLPGTAEGLGLRVESWVEREVPVRWPDGRWVCVLDAEAAGPEARMLDVHDGVLARADGAELWRLGYGVGASGRVGPATRRFLWITVEHVMGEHVRREWT